MQAVTCPDCGTRAEEWDADRGAYVSWARTCPGCEALHQERENHEDNPVGVKVFLLPRRIAEQLDAEVD